MVCPFSSFFYFELRCIAADGIVDDYSWITVAMCADGEASSRSRRGRGAGIHAGDHVCGAVEAGWGAGGSGVCCPGDFGSGERDKTCGEQGCYGRGLRLVAAAPFWDSDGVELDGLHVISRLLREMRPIRRADWQGWERWVKTWSLDFKNEQIYLNVPMADGYEAHSGEGVDSKTQYDEVAAIAHDYESNDEASMRISMRGWESLPMSALLRIPCATMCCCRRRGWRICCSGRAWRICQSTRTGGIPGITGMRRPSTIFIWR